MKVDVDKMKVTVNKYCCDNLIDRAEFLYKDIKDPSKWKITTPEILVMTVPLGGWKEDARSADQPDSVSEVPNKAPTEILRADDGWQKQDASYADLPEEKIYEAEIVSKSTCMEAETSPETGGLTHAPGHMVPSDYSQTPAPFYGNWQQPMQYPVQQYFPTSLEIANAVKVPADPIMGANNY